MLNPRSAWLRALACMHLGLGVLALQGDPAEAQRSRAADAWQVNGNVHDAAGEPVRAAVVSIVESSRDSLVAITRTDSAGRFRFELKGRGSRYSLHVTALGFTPREIAFSAPDAAGQVVITVDMQRIAVGMPAVLTKADRPRPVRERELRTASPGAESEQLDLANGLHGDFSGDLTAALSMVPGLAVVPGADGAPDIGAYGMGPESNGFSLNGVAGSAMSLPRDGLIRMVRMSTYDPRIGGYGGVLVGATLPTGTAYKGRTLRVTSAPSMLAHDPPVQDPSGSGTSEHILSGNVSGPVGRSRYYNAAFQFGGELQSGGNMLASPRGPGAFVPPEVLGRAERSLSAMKLPSSTGAPRILDGSIAARFDFTDGAGPLIDTREPVLYVLATGAFRRQEGIGASPLALPSTWSTRRRDEGYLSLVFAPYLNSVLSETKLSIGAEREALRGNVRLPRGVAWLESDGDSSSASGFASLTFGGAGGNDGQVGRRRVTLSSDHSWMTWTRSHTFNAYVEAAHERFGTRGEVNSLGTFVYRSLEELELGTPSIFVRERGAVSSVTSGWRVAAALGDVILFGDSARLRRTPEGDGLKLQLGLRVEAEGFTDAALEPTLATRIGRRTNAAPGGYAVLPMVGFTWKHGLYKVYSGQAIFSDSRASLTGGIRRYRNSLTPEAVDAVTRHSTLAGASDHTWCSGVAAPRAEWQRYLESPSLIPASCEADAPVALVEQGPSISYFASDFSPASSLRADLKWRWLVSGQLHGYLRGSLASNRSLPSRIDRNLVPKPGLALDDEAQRPVFSPAGLIPATGIIPLSASRTWDDLGFVHEVRSDLRAVQRQVTGGFEYRLGGSNFLSPAAPVQPWLTGVLDLNYTHAWHRQLTDGFTASTAGDPRTRTWQSGAAPQHSIQLGASLGVYGWLNLRFAARINSGYRYTPLVAQDINGDGLANDRAFVVPASSATQSDLHQRIADVARQAPAHAQRCLEQQWGMIAGAHSCAGPWSASLGTLAITVDPYRIGLGHRGTLSLYVENPLGGLDRVLHGNSGRRGWGDPSVPDGRLLSVLGFDADHGRFHYAVNERFGRTATYQRGWFQAPRLTVDLRLDVGTHPETQSLRLLMRDVAAAGWDANVGDVKQQLLSYSRERNNTLFEVLRFADSIGLSEQQRARIEELRTWASARRDTVYDELASYIVSLNGDYSGSAPRKRWHDALSASLTGYYHALAEAREVLDIEQLQWLENNGVSLTYSSFWLERRLRAPLLP